MWLYVICDTITNSESFKSKVRITVENPED